jgi:hypothetical protein
MKSLVATQRGRVRQSWYRSPAGALAYSLAMQEPDPIKADPDERPPGLPGGGSSSARRRVLGLFAVVAVGVATWWLWPATLPGPGVAPVRPPESAADAPVGSEPGPRYPLEAPPEAAPAEPLATLDDSDAVLGRELAELLGAAASRQLLLTDGFVRRFVATIDNLPRRAAPRSKWPVREVAGAFVVGGAEDAPVIDAANYLRYEPHVRVAALLDADAAVAVYRRHYPLLQQAYEELGYPDRYFNDRLVQAIDDLLAAPEVEEPIPLVRPEVLYEFADPALESRSAGQKALIRMGPANARRIKAKLREIRALIAGG